jgi:hypothetical protein
VRAGQTSGGVEGGVMRPAQRRRFGRARLRASRRRHSARTEARPPGRNRRREKACHISRCRVTRWSSLCRRFPSPWRAGTLERQSSVQVLARLASIAKLFRSADGRFCAQVPVGDRLEIYRLKSAAFRDWLIDGFLIDQPEPP